MKGFEGKKRRLWCYLFWGIEKWNWINLKVKFGKDVMNVTDKKVIINKIKRLHIYLCG